MRFDPHKLDEIRARLPVSAVVGRRVSLKKKGREFAGLSPFKTEKTPSFFVNDQKGFYHCFASGEHGDIFTFLMKMEGLSFPEAVERLADEAGVALPKPDPRERDRAEQRLRLHEVHQVAARFFIEQLRGPSGAEARDYLVRRGLADETIRTFGIGYAPNGRTDLLNLLKSQGFSEAEINTSGLVISGADIAKPYDRFRDRVMFPILDLRERVIAFGGRALSSDQPAKYLNSPETPIFHKGHVLFNAARARQRAHKTGAMVVVEGYMDVVALAEAGITNAVAPLGTALTTDQIAQLWRFVDEPLLCFDGDSAGRKAAFRAIDTALPGLQPGKSLRFAFLPDGLDPDDFVRERGVEQLRDLFGAAQSFSDTLWDREWGDGNWATPEKRALLEKRLRDLTQSIEEPGVRSHYQQAMRERCFQAWRAARQAASVFGDRASARSATGPGRDFTAHRPQTGFGRTTAGRNGRFGDGPAIPSSRLKASDLVSSASGVQLRLERMIIGLLIRRPALIDQFDEALAAAEFVDVDCQRALDCLLNAALETNLLDTQLLHSHFRSNGLGRLLDVCSKHSFEHGLNGATGDRGDDEHNLGSDRDLARLLDRHQAVGLEKDLQQAIDDFDRSGSDEDGARVVELKRLLTTFEVAEASPTDALTP